MGAVIETTTLSTAFLIGSWKHQQRLFKIFS